MENETSATATQTVIENKQHHHQLLSTTTVQLPTQQQQEVTKSAIVTNSPAATNIPGYNLIFRDSTSSPSLPAQLPKGKIFNLIPRLVVSNKTPSALQHSRNREPRFVPFEPYKAAINPIVPLHQHRRKLHAIPSNKNNLDLNTLVSHMSLMKAASASSSDTAIVAVTELERQRAKYEAQLDDVRRDRDCVSAQLKSQVQVNTELKHLLVAAVGEDLQTRVNVLTEDKLQLARALLSTAQNLSSHTEQIEYLAGQSEVWRSKFLASSLMVEELARWKATLLQKNKLLTESNRQLLQTLSSVREMGLEELTNLKFLRQQKTLNLPSSSALDVSAECLNISQQLILHSGIGHPASLDLRGLDTTSDSEKLAIEVNLFFFLMKLNLRIFFISGFAEF